VEKLWETCGQMANAPSTGRIVSAMMSLRGPFVDNHTERTNDPAKAVHVLRQQGVTRSFPMQTAEGEIIFEVGGDFTLTADHILELLEREGLDVEGGIGESGEQMTITIQLDPELYNHIRALVHAELDRQKNRQKIEQLASKIRAQLDQLSGPR
jgi:hypothetical protein